MVRDGPGPPVAEKDSVSRPARHSRVCCHRWEIFHLHPGLTAVVLVPAGKSVDPGSLGRGLQAESCWEGVYFLLYLLVKEGSRWRQGGPHVFQEGEGGFLRLLRH